MTLDEKIKAFLAASSGDGSGDGSGSGYGYGYGLSLIHISEPTRPY